MKVSILISIGLATLGLALGYALHAHWLWAGLAIGLGLGWLVGQGWGWYWPAPVGFTLLIGLAAWGVWQGLSPGWFLFSTVAALVAWDLANFAQRQQQAAPEARAAGLAGLHLRRLLPVAGLGWLLGYLALNLHFNLSFGWALLLGLLVILGLSRAIGFLKQGGGGGWRMEDRG